MKLSIFLFICISTLSMASTAKPLGILPQGVKYNIVDLKTDLSQNYLVAELIDAKQLHELVSMDIERQLKESNLLASDDSENTLDLEIFFDYYRRFAGDLTPLPSHKVVGPNFYYVIFIKEGDTIVHRHVSKALTLSVNGYFNLTHDKSENYLTDVKYILSGSRGVADKIKSISPSIDDKAQSVAINKKDRDLSPALSHWLENRTRYDGEVLDYALYIPPSVADGYIISLKRADAKGRTKIYKELFKTWINIPTLYDFIVADVEKRYDTDLDKTEKTELAWAVKAVAASGLKQYHPFIEKIAADERHAYIKKHAGSMKKNLSKFQYQANVVHDTDNLPLELSWEKKQIIVMLDNNYARLRMDAIKKIRSKYLRDRELMGRLETLLLEEAPLSNYRQNGNVDFYSWACRLLAESKDKRYLTTLKTIEESASSKKVRKFAKKFGKILKKS